MATPAAVGATRRARHDRDQVRLLHRAVGGAATRSCTTKVGGIASCCGMAAQQPRAAATQGAENSLSHDGLAKVTTLPLTAWPAEQFRRYAAEVAGLNVDVIVAGNSPAGLAAKNASKTIPIVIATMEDPVQQGFATSLAHPGGSTRGSTSRRWLAAHRPAFRIKLPVT